MPAPSQAADGKPREPRKPKSFLQKYGSPLCFLGFVVCCIIALNRIAASGYFETHMDKVRLVAGEKFLARQRNLPNASVLPSGLIFSILKRGTGDRAPAADDACDVHYLGQYRFWDTFDDSRTFAYPPRRTPASFIPGVAEALQLMREGDKWRLIVPYQLAYGVEGNKSMHLPSFVNVRYTVELLKCPNGAHGRSSEEIDTYLKPFLKEPMPEKPATEHVSADL